MKNHVIMKNPETGNSYIFTKDGVFISYFDKSNKQRKEVSTLHLSYEDMQAGWECEQSQKALEEITKNTFKLGSPISHRIIEDNPEDLYGEKELGLHHNWGYPIL